jgi:hypothetical protein
MNTRVLYRCALLGALLGAACESRPDPASNAIAQIASANPVLMGARPATATAAARPAQASVRRPSGEADLVLSAERRTRIEHAFPEAKGFLALSEVEAALYARELRRGKEPAAVSAFDDRAKGKWVLFTGNVVAPSASGFTLPVRYTPRDANDRMGLTSTWFGVEFEQVRGYDATAYEPGELVAILARYNGNKSAGPGYDLLLLNRWFQ